MRCIACGGEITIRKSNEYHYRTKEFKTILPNIEIGVCDECHLHQVLFNHSMMEDINKKLTEYYSRVYRNDVKLPSLNNKHQILYVRGKFIANTFRQYYEGSEPPCVFEKGAGMGFNLLHVKKAFYDAELYTDEMDIHSKTYLNHIGAKTVKLEEASKKFDFMIVSHVLEHLLNPAEVLFQAYDHLNSKGLLYIEVPCDLEYEEPHVTFWLPTSVEYLINSSFSAKYKIISIRSTGITRKSELPKALRKFIVWVRSIKIINRFLYVFYDFNNPKGTTLKVLLQKN